MSTLFTTIVNSILDNNANGNEWRDWDNAQHAIDTYGEDYSGDISAEEMEVTVKALDMLIESNGEKWDEAVNMWNEAVWGTTFANDYGPVPFSG